ncbi:MAG: dihydroorotase [Firmicutes bacterium]|nr:dihydroorotase [Bacillota bacterium]
MIENRRFYLRTDDIGDSAGAKLRACGVDTFSFSDCYILPGLTDVHVHLREPGFLYKETIATGSMAAAAGGFTKIFAMPNVNPVPDSVKNLKVQTEAIAKDGRVRVYPYGAITAGEKGEILSDMEEIAKDVIAFTDDGRGVMSDDLMRMAMIQAKAIGKLIVAHCEDESFPRESSEAEWKQLERDIQLVRETGCGYHMCHVSTKESVALIRQAKAEGLDVSCETAPHYLVLSRETVEDDGRFKMNPPIKEEADRQALIEAILDGTIDMIATDHAPHSADEKKGGMAKAAYGIVGLETAVPVMYTSFVKTGIITMDKLVELMYVRPNERFGLAAPTIEELLRSNHPDISIWDFNSAYEVNPDAFLTKGRSTPFEGMKVSGRCLATLWGGRLAYERKN